MSDEQKLLDAILRNDLVAFTEKAFATLAPATPLMRNWHLQALAHCLKQCINGEIRRLIITLPPRSLKSVFCSVAFPAFVLGHQPSKKVVCVSYSQELAGEHARACRDIMESDWYRRMFPRTRLDRRRTAEFDFKTTARGGRLSTSPGGSLTGRGGNLIIIDDPIKADDVLSDVRRNSVIEWFRQTLITRLDDKRNDVIILVMQRLHVDDLAGVLLETGDWVHLNLPAIAQEDETIQIDNNVYHIRRKGDLLHAEREGAKELAELERTLGRRAFAAQYLQQPIAPDGTIIHWSWFKFFDWETLPERRPSDEIVQCWDTAAKAGLTNDYSVGTTWLIRDGLYYLLDLYRDRLEFPDLRRKIIDYANQWKVDRVVIEDASSGEALLQDLGRSRPAGSTWWLEPFRFEKDKVLRAEAHSVPIEQGLVYLLRDAPWLEPLRQEIRMFPRGSHDDQVDSISQFLAWVRTRVIYATRIAGFLPRSG
jgi:predicted phage terminase large subunit-like protein